MLHRRLLMDQNSELWNRSRPHCKSRPFAGVLKSVQSFETNVSTNMRKPPCFRFCSIRNKQNEDLQKENASFRQSSIRHIPYALPQYPASNDFNNRFAVQMIFAKSKLLVGPPFFKSRMKYRFQWEFSQYYRQMVALPDGSIRAARPVSSSDSHFLSDFMAYIDTGTLPRFLFRFQFSLRSVFQYQKENWNWNQKEKLNGQCEQVKRPSNLVIEHKKKHERGQVLWNIYTKNIYIILSTIHISCFSYLLWYKTWGICKTNTKNILTAWDAVYVYFETSQGKELI